MAGTCCRLVILGMARIACGGKPLELPHRGALVAGVAIERGMRAHQRKAVLVVLDLLHRNLPPFYRVALFAGGAELALVNVSMAVGALRRHIAENQFRVTRHARHFLVHAAQRIPGLVVIELRNAANGLPSAERVAVLARDVQRPVRTTGRLAALLGRRACGTHQRKQDQPRNSLDCSSRLRHEFFPRSFRTTL